MLFDFWCADKEFIDKTEIQDAYDEIVSAQDIAPSRIYVNVLRIIRNNYYDKTFNGQKLNYWRFRYANKIKTFDDAKLAVDTVFASMNDAYSMLYGEGMYNKQKALIKAKLSAGGMIWEKNDNKEYHIVYISEGSAAEYADIQVGDKILEADYVLPTDKKFKKVLYNLKKGIYSEINLRLERNGEEIERVLLPYDMYIRTMDYIVLDNGIVLLKLYNIMGSKTVPDFKTMLLNTNNAKAMIIDLRYNMGGIPANAVRYADLMIDDGEFFTVKSRNNKSYTIKASKGKIFKSKPVIILVNRYTASTAEIFAGILQYNKIAVLEGERTFGKNSIQQMFAVHNGGGLNLTTAKYILPENNDISGVGLKPDIYLKRTSEKDVQLEKALKLAEDMVKNNE